MKMTTILFHFVLLAVGMTACKDIGLDDEAQDALSCLSGMRCDEDDSTSQKPNDAKDDDDDNDGDDSDDTDEKNDTATSSGSGTSASGSGSSTTGSSSSSGSSTSGTSSTGSGGSSTAGTGTTAATDPGDSTGGITTLPSGSKGTSRFFMGTYELSASYYYDDCTDAYWGNGYDFPGVIRGYSHGNSLDFEDNFGNLRWIAAVFPDDTFDFNVQFLDSFGNPSNIVACTCYIEEPYSYSYDSDTIKCTCDPSYAGDTTCSLTYDMM